MWRFSIRAPPSGSGGKHPNDFFLSHEQSKLVLRRPRKRSRPSLFSSSRPSGRSCFASNRTSRFSRAISQEGCRKKTTLLPLKTTRRGRLGLGPASLRHHHQTLGRTSNFWGANTPKKRLKMRHDSRLAPPSNSTEMAAFCFCQDRLLNG